MLIVGLTGGIAAGKSTVSQRFAELGAAVIDADVIARELVEPGRPALAEIVELFGPQFLQADGGLDRGRLKSHVFADDRARRQLEAILHPRIEAEMRERVQTVSGPYCVFVIPLLLEVGQQHLVDRILVVDAPVAVQRERLRRRDQLTEARIDAILAAQIDPSRRQEAADDVIVNDGDVNHLMEQVDRLDGQYRALAAAAHGSD